MIDTKTIDRARMDELKKIASANAVTYGSELEKLCAFANKFIGYMLEELDKEMKAKEQRPATKKCTCPPGFVRETTGHQSGCPTLQRTS